MKLTTPIISIKQIDQNTFNFQPYNIQNRMTLLIFKNHSLKIIHNSAKSLKRKLHASHRKIIIETLTTPDRRIYHEKIQTFKTQSFNHIMADRLAIIIFQNIIITYTHTIRTP